MWLRRELNSRPNAYETCALPLSYSANLTCILYHGGTRSAILEKIPVMQLKRIFTILNDKRIDSCAWFISALFAIGGIILNLNKYWQYDTGHYDLGIFDSAIWKVSRFQLPIIEHMVAGGRIIWADHFHPSIFLLSPLYWFTDRPEIILIAQDVLVGLSGVVLYYIGVRLLKDRFLALCVVMAYFLFTGLQNAVLFDFHELTMSTVFIMLTYWAFFADKKKLFFLFFLITIGFKESLFLFGMGLSIFMFFTKKTWRKQAIMTGIFSAMYGVFTVGFLIPFFSHNQYQYGPGKYNSIFELIQRLYTPIIKVKTLLWTSLSFSFLPLLVPTLFPLIALHYTGRFLNPFGERWDLGLHYNAEIAPTLAVATVLGLVFLLSKFQKKYVYVVGLLLVLNSLVLYRFILHGPYGLVYNPAFHAQTKKFGFIDDMMKVVPKDTSVSVMSQNNLLGRFSHHDKIKLLSLDYKKHNVDYILFDLRAGQNPNNYLFLTESQFKKIFEIVKKDEDYEMIYGKGDQFAFRRK